MLYISANPAGLGWTIRIFCLLIVSCSVLPVWGQFEEYEPEPSYHGQNISVHFYLSQPGDSSWYGSEIELVHHYHDSLDFDPSSKIVIDVEGSGYGAGTDLEVVYELSLIHI